MAEFELMNWLSNLATVGLPSVLVSSGLFKWLGNRWIDSHFQKQLQALKHEQEKELENVRLQVQLMHGRVSKIHQREFDVLPKAWLMLQEAYGWTARTVAIYKEYPDVKSLSDQKLREMLGTLKFTPVQITELMESSERQEDFIKAYDSQQLDGANESLKLLNNFILEHQIFLDKDLRTKLKGVTKDLLDAVSEFTLAKNDRDADAAIRCHEIMEGIGPKVDEIGTHIQKRLHYDEA